MNNFRLSSRYDHAMFWLAMGAVVVTIGGILWSRGGVIAVVAGALMLWWALTLYLAHRHSEGHFCPDPEAHRLPQSGASGPELLSVLRRLRADLKDAARKIEGSQQNGKFWPAGTEGDLQDKTWRKDRGQLQGMSGMNPLWDTLEDAYLQVKRVSELRTSRVFGGYRVHADDELDVALESVGRAIDQLETKIASLDAVAD